MVIHCHAPYSIFKERPGGSSPPALSTEDPNPRSSLCTGGRPSMMWRFRVRHSLTNQHCSTLRVACQPLCRLLCRLLEWGKMGRIEAFYGPIPSSPSPCGLARSRGYSILNLEIRSGIRLRGCMGSVLPLRWLSRTRERVAFRASLSRRVCCGLRSGPICTVGAYTSSRRAPT